MVEVVSGGSCRRWGEGERDGGIKRGGIVGWDGVEEKKRKSGRGGWLTRE